MGAPAPRQEPQLLVGVGTGAKGVAALGYSGDTDRKKVERLAPKQGKLDVEGMSVGGGPKIQKLFGRHSGIARGDNMQHKRHVRDQ